MNNVNRNAQQSTDKRHCFTAHLPDELTTVHSMLFIFTVGNCQQYHHNAALHYRNTVVQHKICYLCFYQSVWAIYIHVYNWNTELNLKLNISQHSSTRHEEYRQKKECLQRYKVNGYWKTLYFSCILIWRFWSVEISLHFNLAFSQGVLCKAKFHVTLAISYEQNVHYCLC